MTKQEPNPQTKAHVKDFALLFSVPLGAIVLILAFLYIPRFFAHPSYDFIYCEGYSCNEKFLVGPTGRLQASTDTDYFVYSLYYYDVRRDATRPLQIDEAINYQLDPASKAPDGYTLKHSARDSGFLLWGGNYNDNWSLQKGIPSKPVALDMGGSDKKFIGWVLHND